MVATATRTGSYDAPWRSSPEVWQHFRDEADLLRHLQQTWRHALAGEVYIAIERGEGDLPEDVTRAFRTTCRRYDGIRKILEAHQHHPAISAAMRKERSLLSCLVSGPSDEQLGDLTAA